MLCPEFYNGLSQSGRKVIKLLMLSSAETKIYPAHKC